MRSMTKSEREAFLAEERIGVLSLPRDGQAPFTVPIWYRYEPGEDVIFTAAEGSSIDRLMQGAGSTFGSLCVHDDRYPYRAATAQGPVEIMRRRVPEDLVEIARRYLPPDQAEAYASGTTHGGPLLRLHPERWITSDFSG